MARDIVIERLSLLEVVRFLEQIAGELAELRLAQSLMREELSANQWGSIESLAVLIAKQEGVSKDHAREWVRAQFESAKHPTDDT